MTKSQYTQCIMRLLPREFRTAVAQKGPHIIDWGWSHLCGVARQELPTALQDLHDHWGILHLPCVHQTLIDSFNTQQSKY